jgi:glycosyltransferase involved in cell wall biosynthesis
MTVAAVLIVSSEPVGERMVGSAIRAFELARALAPHATVELACPDDGGAEPALAFGLTRFDRADARALRGALARADVVVAQPPWPHVAAELRRSGKRLVFDLYDPEPLENLELLAGRKPALRHAVSTLTLDRFAAALRDGDHLMCASEAQRALWLGMMLAERLLPPAVYDADPTLRSRLDVVPFGVPDEPPVIVGPGPRDVLEGLAADDELVLWNGGVWPWLDAPTAIRAVAELAVRRPRVKLVFMGAGAAGGPAAAAYEEARRVAAELDAPVLFNTQWVPYAERAAWLTQADCAISTHRDHLETRFAFRTRLLDCFWTGLPVVATEGDELAARVARDGLGAAVPAGDVAATAAALERVLDRGRDAHRAALAQAAAELRWSQVVAPLVRWVTSPPPARARRRGGRPLARGRDAGFRALLGGLGAVGLRRWPRL